MQNVFKDLDKHLKGLTGVLDDLVNVQYAQVKDKLPEELKNVYSDAIKVATESMTSKEGFSPKKARDLTKVVNSSTEAYLKNQKS